MKVLLTSVFKHENVKFRWHLYWSCQHPLSRFRVRWTHLYIQVTQKTPNHSSSCPQLNNCGVLTDVFTDLQTGRCSTNRSRKCSPIKKHLSTIFWPTSCNFEFQEMLHYRKLFLRHCHHENGRIKIKRFSCPTQWWMLCKIGHHCLQVPPSPVLKMDLFHHP